MSETDRLKEIEERYWDSATYEGIDYKFLSMGNSDIEFLIELGKRALETEKQQEI